MICQGKDAQGLKAAFHEAAEDYLKLCKTAGRKADLPLYGIFNLYFGPDLNCSAMNYARSGRIDHHIVVSDALLLGTRCAS